MIQTRIYEARALKEAIFYDRVRSIGLLGRDLDSLPILEHATSILRDPMMAIGGREFWAEVEGSIRVPQSLEGSEIGHPCLLASSTYRPQGICHGRGRVFEGDGIDQGQCSLSDRAICPPGV